MKVERTKKQQEILKEEREVYRKLKKLTDEHCALESVAKVIVENPDITDFELGLIAHEMSFVVEDDFPDGAKKFLEIASNLM